LLRSTVIGAGIVGNCLVGHLSRLGWTDMVLLDKGLSLTPDAMPVEIRVRRRHAGSPDPYDGSVMTSSRPRTRLVTTRLHRVFSGYRSRARDLLQDPAALEDLAAQAKQRASGSPNSRIRELADQIKRLGRLVRAYANGSYREISVGNIVLVVAAILYFVTPLDLVPDALPGAGLVDDATVLAFVLARLDGELAQFAAWERADAITVE